MSHRHISRHPLKTATRIATLAAFITVAIPVAVAQGQLWTFSGTVVDQTNRVVPGVTLVLVNDATPAKYEVRTDGTGRFEFPGLPSGDYHLAAQQVGFATFTDAIEMAGKDVARRIQLKIGRVRETIRVAGGQAEPAQSILEQQARLEEARRRAQDARRRVSEKCAGGATAGEIGGQILPPIKVIDVRPDYPEALKAAGIGGVVTLDGLIGTDGAVRDVTVVSAPHPELERAAGEAVRRWEFTTTYLNCTPIEVPMRVTVSFVTR